MTTEEITDLANFLAYLQQNVLVDDAEMKAVIGIHLTVLQGALEQCVDAL